MQKLVQNFDREFMFAHLKLSEYVCWELSLALYDINIMLFWLAFLIGFVYEKVFLFTSKIEIMDSLSHFFLMRYANCFQVPSSSWNLGEDSA